MTPIAPFFVFGFRIWFEFRVSDFEFSQTSANAVSFNISPSFGYSTATGSTGIVTWATAREILPGLRTRVNKGFGVMMNARNLLITCIVASGMLTASIASAAEAKKHGKADSRSPFPHRIMLLDEKGNGINPAPKDPKQVQQPYATSETCGKCHDYAAIDKGWHFNAGQSGIDNGRPGEPWILTDSVTRTQIPLSYRGWPGTFRPADLGISDWYFVQTFARQMPGGGVAERPSTQPADREAYWKLSGTIQNDCMICHDGDETYSTADRKLELEKMNFEFAATKALGLGRIDNSVRSIVEEAKASEEDPNASRQSPKVIYDPRRFDNESPIRAVLNVSRSGSADRCYFCHTTNVVGPAAHENWQADKDVHLRAGMTCSDCHRHGLDHQVVRGYEAEATTRKDAAALSCRGCHMGSEAGEGALSMGGRLGAPRPVHNGIPPIHFDRLSCTACHAGPYPTETPANIQTSMAHGLGLESFERTPESLPHIVAPIFLRSIDNKITPHKMVWPNYWAVLKRESVMAISPARAKTLLGAALADLQAKPGAGLSDTQISKALAAIGASKDLGGEAVYISGGKMFRRSADGKISAAEHPAAKPYAWAIGHDVRPASQSLGARGCGDCHSSSSPIYFTQVIAQGPVTPANALARNMASLRGDSGFMAWLFAFTFNFRMMLKVISFACATILFAILVLYGLRGLGWLTSRMS